MSRLPDPFVPHDRLTAAEMNALVGFVADRAVMRGGSFIRVQKLPGGWGLSLDLDALRPYLAPGRPELWAEITGVSGSGYQWKEILPTSAGVWADRAEGRTSTECGYAYEAMLRTGVPTGTRVRLWGTILADETRAWFFERPLEVFPVLVAMDGGVAGDDATDCTWTYTVKDLAGVSLAATVTPERPRYSHVAYTQAPDDSLGLAVWSGATLKLLIAFEEIETTDVCP